MTIDEMLAKLKGTKMDYWQKRAQKIDFAVGQMLAMRNGHLFDEWDLRKTVAEMLESK